MANRYKGITRRADVAKHANVSETIVSYVVNNNRYVDKAKRLRVEQAIKELNYRPNPIARVLKGKKSNNIAFIADEISNEHFSLLMGEIEKNAYEFGYMISLCSNRNSEEFASQIISRHYDGIIISSISIEMVFIQQFLAAGIPVVLLRNRDYQSIKGVAYIDTGLYDGARECVRFLVGSGRKNILYMDRFSQHGNFSTMEDLRFRGFVEEMKAQGIENPQNNVLTGYKNEEEVARAIKQIFSHNAKKYDALFCRNDRLACIGMQTLQQMGVEVPRQVAVMGFDNSRLSRYTSPTLSTVEMQREEIGKAAIRMINEMIEGNANPDPVHFSTKIIQRQSTK